VQLVIASAFDPTRTDEQMCVQLIGLVDQSRDVFGRMLAIGVALHNAFVAMLNRVTEPAPQRAADTKVHRQLDDYRAGLASAAGCEVYRPIDNNSAIEAGGQHSLNDATDRCLFVIRRDQDERRLHQ
jgi:hypothetical protein